MIRKRTILLDNERKTTENSISEYALERPMTKAQIVVVAEKIKMLFNINDGAIDVMCSIFAEEFWPLRKTEDAIKYVIKTHKYKEVKPADILSYDKGIPFYSYIEMIELGDQGFRCVIIPGISNMKRISDSLSGESIDVGWYVRIDQALPESWKDWSKNATKQI